MARRRGLGRGGCRPSPGAAPPSVLTLRGAGCPPRRAPSSALPPRLQLSASFSQSEMAKWRCQTDTRGVPRPGQPRRDLRRERCTRRGVCVCVCVCVSVCLSVSQWIAERQSQRTAAPARGRILRPEPRGGRCWDSPARTWVPPPLRNHPLRLLPATLSRAPSLPLHLISLRSVLV